MRAAAALLLSLGAHLTLLSLADRLTGSPATAASGGSAAGTPLRAVLAAGRDEPEPAPPRAQQSRRPRLPLPTRYLPAVELDSRPQVKTHVMPRYPEGVLSGTRGRVVLQLLVGSDGQVDAVSVERAEPRGVFEEAAVKAFAEARFSPGTKHGAAVPALLRIEVKFGD